MNMECLKVLLLFFFFFECQGECLSQWHLCNCARDRAVWMFTRESHPKEFWAVSRGTAGRGLRVWKVWVGEGFRDQQRGQRLFRETVE